MRRIQKSRISVQLVLVLTAISLLWVLFSIVHDRVSPNLPQYDHDDTILRSCLKEGNKSDIVRAAKEAQATLGPVFEDDYIQQWRNGTKPHDTNTLSAHEVTTHTKEIMEVGNGTMWRLQCQNSIAARYDSMTENDGRIQYLFAVDLYQAISVLPTLLGSKVQTIRFLGPRRCAVSFVEGRSTDGTYQILAALKVELEQLGVVFYMSISDVSPQDGKQDRFEGLAWLRNLALAPLVMDKAKFSPDAQIVFSTMFFCVPMTFWNCYTNRKCNTRP